MDIAAKKDNTNVTTEKTRILIRLCMIVLVIRISGKFRKLYSKKNNKTVNGL